MFKLKVALEINRRLPHEQRSLHDKVDALQLRLEALSKMVMTTFEPG